MKFSTLSITLLMGAGALAVPVFPPRDWDPSASTSSDSVEPSGYLGQKYRKVDVKPADLSLNTTAIIISSPVQGDVTDKLATANSEADNGTSASAGASNGTEAMTLISSSNGTVPSNSTDGEGYDTGSNAPVFDTLGDDSVDGCDDSEDVYEAVLEHVQAQNSTNNSTSLLASPTEASGDAECSDETVADGDDDDEEDDDDDEDLCGDDTDEDDEDEDDDECDVADSSTGNSTISDLSPRLSSTINDTFGPGTQSTQMKEGQAAGEKLKTHGGSNSTSSSSQQAANATTQTGITGGCKAQTAIQTVPTAANVTDPATNGTSTSLDGTSATSLSS